jgi:hypothetical protein
MNRARAGCIWAAASWRLKQELVGSGRCNSKGSAKRDAEAQYARIRISFSFMGKPDPAEVSKFEDFKENPNSFGLQR